MSTGTAGVRGDGATVPVPARVARWARADPDRVAVLAGPCRLTFGELDAQGRRWAALLRGAEARPGACVAVLLPRGPRFVVVTLGILAAGAAYLPLDVATPAARVEEILRDAGAAVVVADPDRAPRGPWTVLDPEQPSVTGPAAAGPPPAGRPPGPDDLAYVVYTSGSTGRPKGVEITHANLAHLVDWHVAAFGVTGSDRASQVAGLGFDAAGWEIWPHLAAGAALHVADEETRHSPALLRDWLVAEGITIAFAPTLLAEQLMSADWPALTALRTLLTGAERLTRRPRPGLPFRVVNNYGPTECTVVATSGAVGTDGDGPPSIGRPRPGTLALVLDGSRRPVADGAPGELVLVGPHVGRGYRGDPELTADRFPTVTLDDGTSARGYRTGDRVRRHPDRRLAFLGRLDDQVKVRGYRIEPAEVADRLHRCPGVGAAAVVALDGEDDGDRELAAYVVPSVDPPPAAADVRAFLAAQLPDYMVPAHVVTLPALPTTPNGKLDAAALPHPRDTGPAPAPPDWDPAEVQEWVAELVATLLGRPTVGPDDDIFLLGGHSMLAMQVVSRVRQHYGVQLSLRRLFAGPSVTAIATEIGRRRGATA